MFCPLWDLGGAGFCVAEHPVLPMGCKVSPSGTSSLMGDLGGERAQVLKPGGGEGAGVTSCFFPSESRKQGSEDNLKCNDLPNVGEEEVLS